MSADLHILPTASPDVLTMVHSITQRVGFGERGLVVVVTDDGVSHIQHNLNDHALAYVAAMLLRHATSGEMVEVPRK